MMSEQFLIYDQETDLKTTSFKIGETIIPAPAYIPEIKGPEDIRALLRYPSAMPRGNPIMVPAYQWPKLMKDPRLRSLVGSNLVRDFIAQHPIYLYDPPELYKYTLGREFYKYALRGEGITKFEKILKDERDAVKAIGLIPEFFKPFVEKQMKSIQRKLGIFDGNSGKPHVEQAWLDNRIDVAYAPYVLSLAAEAIKIPNAVLIPPVPPLISSSDESYVSRVISSNRMASFVCEKISRNAEYVPGESRRSIYPYFHLYLDWSIVDQHNRGINVDRIGDILDDELKAGSFAGVAITLIGYENASKDRGFRKIEHFITQMVNICSQYYLPIILPRSEWYGLALTDLEIQGFGSLMNGKARYMPKGGGRNNPEDLYGRTPIIERCCEIKKSEVVRYVKEHGEIPSAPGLPKKPTQEQLDNHTLYREAFSKPMRLIHIDEAYRMRKDKAKGIIEPAKLYFSRSDHNSLRDNCI
jgi:hypothetical protein